MLIISCSGGSHIGPKIARKLKAKHSKLFVEKFPDGELYLKYNVNLKKKKVVLVQSFYGNIQDQLMEVIFAAETAKDLGAKKVILVAPFFPYFRQDKRFHSGECISIKVIADIVDRSFDGVIVVDPHLHRQRDLHHVFAIKSKRLSANNKISEYIKKNIKDPILVGPDVESYKWAKKVGDKIGVESYIYKKKRYSSHHVKVKLNKKIDLKGRNVVIVDDMISTGHTMLETVYNLKRLKPKSISCICVHGIFIGKIIGLLKKEVNVVSSNTIYSKQSKIDVSGEICDALKSWK
tara:strand:+ start:25177 stop:26052 length:876 start_codon:yes stop_codon:yes gene_type:complete